MHRTAYWLAAVIGFAAPALAGDGMILRAGEWMVARDGQSGEPMKICYGEDHKLGQLAAAGMNECVQSSAASPDKVLTIDAICQMANGRVIVHGTIRPTGADAWRADSRITFEGAKSNSVSLGITARRLGPCQPGDAPG
nr:DUF3617 family protein [uncultured Rhodopila sp.]